MKVTLEEEQIKTIIKKYYSEVEGIEIGVNFSSYEDYQFTVIQASISKKVEIAGIKAMATEDVDNMKIAEIFNYYLPNDYNFKKVTFTSYRVNLPREDYEDHVRAVVEFEPVNQKTKGRHI